MENRPSLEIKRDMILSWKLSSLAMSTLKTLTSARAISEFFFDDYFPKLWNPFTNESLFFVLKLSRAIIAMALKSCSFRFLTFPVIKANGDLPAKLELVVTNLLVSSFFSFPLLSWSLLTD